MKKTNLLISVAFLLLIFCGLASCDSEDRNIKKALKENLEFMSLIGKGLAQKLMQSNTNGAINLLHSLEERLCAYMIQASYQGIFCEKLTDVAIWLGTSYRHLLRILEKLCKEQILKKQKGMYLILDEKALKERASEEFIQLCCKSDAVSG